MATPVFFNEERERERGINKKVNKNILKVRVSRFWHARLASQTIQPGAPPPTCGRISGSSTFTFPFIIFMNIPSLSSVRPDSSFHAEIVQGPFEMTRQNPGTTSIVDDDKSLV